MRSARWYAERTAWAVMAIVLAASLFGLLGDGPMSAATAHAPGVTARYERLQRQDAPAEYRIDADAALARSGAITVRLDQRLLELMRLERIEPEPSAARTTSRGVEYDIDVRGAGTASVVLRYRPSRFGRYQGRLEVVGAPPLVVDQFVYP